MELSQDLAQLLLVAELISLQIGKISCITQAEAEVVQVAVKALFLHILVKQIAAPALTWLLI